MPTFEAQRKAAELQRQLATLTDPLVIIVHLAPEDPRYVDLKREVLAKLERAMAHVSISPGHIAAELRICRRR